MKRFMFYPICKYDVLDKKLADMEASGYRLDHVSPFWIFHFKPCKPRQVHYMTTYKFLKEFDRCGYNLLTQYEANETSGNPVNFSGLVSIYRITKSDIELSEIVLERNQYLRHTSWRKIQISFVFLIFNLFPFLSDYPSIPRTYLTLIVMIILSLICVIWNLISLFILHLKNTQSR